MLFLRSLFVLLSLGSFQAFADKNATESVKKTGNKDDIFSGAELRKLAEEIVSKKTVEAHSIDSNSQDNRRIW